MPAATMVEHAVLAAASQEDVHAALERLGGIGSVVVLVTPADRLEGVPPLSRESGLLLADWAGISVDRSLGGTAYSGGGRRLDPAAIARLTELRAEHGANWLLATEATLASARACPGLHVVCVGPAVDDADPTRPDHRAHSLLDAARFIQTALTFG